MGMGRIWHVAANVFKESVRDKVLYNLIVFALLLIAVSYLLGQLTGGSKYEATDTAFGRCRG